MQRGFTDETNPELTKKTAEWWNKNPFTYFVKKGGGSTDSNASASGADWAFFRNIDRKIIKWMPWAQKGYPLLSSVIDYSTLRGKKVLDIAVGSGWTTEQFARSGAEVTAIDITPQAVELTKKRLALYGLNADVRLMDAQHLQFPEETFDFALAFGCLMHMPDTQKAIDGIYRVLKAGGRTAAMMYNKNSLHWWWYIFFGKGVLRGKLMRMSMQELSNRYTDGAYDSGNELTKFYTQKEVRKMFGTFKKVRVRIFDDFTCINHFPHRFLPLGSLLPKRLKEKLTRIVGQTLWIDAEK